MNPYSDPKWDLLIPHFNSIKPSFYVSASSACRTINIPLRSALFRPNEYPRGRSLSCPQEDPPTGNRAPLPVLKCYLGTESPLRGSAALLEDLGLDTRGPRDLLVLAPTYDWYILSPLARSHRSGAAPGVLHPTSLKLKGRLLDNSSSRLDSPQKKNYWGEDSPLIIELRSVLVFSLSFFSPRKLNLILIARGSSYFTI